jgi:vacuolar protein sorting-associated protein 18
MAKILFLNRYGYVGQNQPCDICGYSVMTRQFYMFPCLHVYHGDCLQKEVMVHLDEEQQRRVTQLETAIASESPSKTVLETVDVESVASVGSVMTEMEKLKTALDDIIASECLLCGSIMINSIDQPFYNPSDSLLADSWKI